MITPKARRFWSPKAKRVVIAAVGELKVVQPILLRSIAKRTQLHPHHYGVSGRPTHDLIYQLMVAKAKGHFVGSADIPKAFPNTPKKFIRRDLVKMGVPTSVLLLFGLEKMRFVGPNQKPVRGVAQGFSASPCLFARHMDVALRRLNNGRYKVWLYADNLFWAAPTYQKAKKAQKYIESVLKRRGLCLHVTGNKAAKICRPHEPLKVLGLTINVKRKNMMSDNTQDELSDEPALKAQNARFLFETILKLKKQANLSQEPNIVSDDMDLLAPSTLIADVQSVDNCVTAKQWYSTWDDCHLEINHWRGRYRKIERGEAYLDKVGLGDLGAKGDSLFSTYSASQRKMMLKQNEGVTCALETCRVKWRDFQSDQLLHEGAYRFVRDELWACYMAFCPLDTLTRLSREHGYKALRRTYAESPAFAGFLRHCYFNELRAIDGWIFKKAPVPLVEHGSKEVIQQILRGYATAMLILISQPRVIHTPPLGEYEIGRFRFPVMGFNDGSMSEIEDLADACRALISGFAVIPPFKQIITDLISERISSPVVGEPTSNLRWTSDLRVWDLYAEIGPEDTLLDSYPQLKNLPKPGDDDNENCRFTSSEKVAKQYNLPSYHQQVLKRKTRIHGCVRPRRQSLKSDSVEGD